MIKLTELGKKMYGNRKLLIVETVHNKVSLIYEYAPNHMMIIAENPSDIKALLDMRLIEFESVDKPTDSSK